MSKKQLTPAVDFFPDQDNVKEITKNSEVDNTKESEQNTSNDSVKTIVVDKELETNKDTLQDISKDSEVVNNLGSNKETEQNRGHDTIQYTMKLPEKNEPFNYRLVSNVTKKQKEYVQKMGKKFGNESDFVRHMINHFMKAIKVEE